MIVYDLKIKIPDDFRMPIEQSSGKGKHCFIYGCPSWVKEEFGLNDKKLLLKVFHAEPLKDKEVRNINWGDDPKGTNPRINTTLFEATKIQNICCWEGLAPRVYALLIVKWKNEEYIAQLTEDIGTNFKEEHKDAEEAYEKVKKLGEKYGFQNDKNDVSKWDVIDDKLIDFQTFAFNESYPTKLRQVYKDGTKWGKIYYHAVPEIGLGGGPRKMEQRIKEMELDKVDFEGKTVLDLGCSGGAFVNYAIDRGAKKAVGIDFQKDIEGARLMSNHLGYFNAEYYGADLRIKDTQMLREMIGIDKFDIVLYLSMFRHVYFPSFVWELCKDTAIIEWNNWKSEEEIKKLVEEKFKIIRIGRTTDHGTGKPFYICRPL